MNIELKPIAESKVRQLGGDVCGVLVRTEDGVMAVSEHGRCTRIDAGVMGPIDGAQGDQGAGVVGYTNRRQLQFPVNGWGMLWPEKSELADVELYTQPQPAVPEGFEVLRRSDGIMVTRMSDGGCAFYEKDSRLVTQVMAYHLLDALLSTPTTPQADGWVKCEDRLPTEADDDFNGCVWARFEDGDIALMEGEEVEQTWDDDISITHWMPTGLKRPAPPAEQEGSGDE